MIGDRIKELRNSRGLTQEQLADSLDINQSTIGMIETNKREPGKELLIKFADYFGVTTDYLMDRNIELAISTDNPDIRAIARAGEKLSSDEAAELRKFAERLFPNAFKKTNS